MRRVSFTVPGELIGKGSMRAYTYRRKDGKVGARATADNPATEAWEASIAWEAKRAIEDDPRLFEGPVKVQLLAYFQRPRSISRQVRPLPVVKPDVDKLSRIVFDALTGVLYRDDAQVISLLARKLYTDHFPRVEIVVADYLGPEFQETRP